jgi:AcrR family transcriptional regulator
VLTNLGRVVATTRPSARRSAADRRDEISEIAIRHFAISGYRGTSTDLIAREAGISQPYLFRLFQTKRDLFLACHEVMHARIRETFAAAARGVPEGERLDAMGHAYVDLLADRTALLFQMQSYAACADPDIQAQVRLRYGELVREVERISGATAPELWRFFSHGMLLNVVVSLDLASIAGEDEWAAQWTDPGALIDEG